MNGGMNDNGLRQAPALLTGREAAALLGIHRDTLRNWRDHGHLPRQAWVRIGSTCYYRRTVVEALARGEPSDQAKGMADD